MFCSIIGQVQVICLGRPLSSYCINLFHIRGNWHFLSNFTNNKFWAETIKLSLESLPRNNKMNCELMLTYDTPAYMFNVYKNQLSRQTGSRNLTGSKTLPTIWHTYMKLVTKYQISAINSCWEKCDEKYLGRTEERTEVKQYIPLRWSGGIIKHKQPVEVNLFLIRRLKFNWIGKTQLVDQFQKLTFQKSFDKIWLVDEVGWQNRAIWLVNIVKVPVS